ncbi:hypothetical protein HH303_16065 [Rhodospirillaceae bacterium KN72]|uniref:Uncharacterized protein n=1 Tax=Pacificispira spongiicola TaxID=2729598 RepID=A0A7Y0HGU0_9PROT|nr:hypothetical protein [Pacificispira spongiicola]NMM46013.1 hypothetical protein [Pacificispira spongiicola]
MTEEFSLTEQRDRYVAFAFAAADVLLEVDDSGVVVFAAGSVKALLHRTAEELKGQDVAVIAAETDAAVLGEFVNKLKLTGRVSDQWILAHPGADGKPTPISVSGMSSPQRKGIHHLSIKALPLRSRETVTKAAPNPMSVLDFANAAAIVGTQSRDAGEEMNFAFYDVNWDHVEKTVSREDADRLNDSLVQTMRAWSSGGSGVGQVGRGRYSVLLDDGIDASAVSKRMAEIAKDQCDYLVLDVEEASLPLGEIVNSDDFGPMFEKAMRHFNDVGGRAFDLKSFDDTKKIAPILPKSGKRTLFPSKKR